MENTITILTEKDKAILESYMKIAKSLSMICPVWIPPL